MKRLSSLRKNARAWGSITLALIYLISFGIVDASQLTNDQNRAYLQSEGKEIDNISNKSKPTQEPTQGEGPGQFQQPPMPIDGTEEAKAPSPQDSPGVYLPANNAEILKATPEENPAAEAGMMPFCISVPQ